jgi:glycerophosphoryl diester phosphodiesterase
MSELTARDAGDRAGTADRTLIVAHRGAWTASVPQNSLEAFEAAIELGCDLVELDVRRAGDGQLVVVHDARVGGRPVARTETEALRRRLKDGQAPGLEEVLEGLAGRVGLDIELKVPGLTAQAMGLIARRLSPTDYVITSFRPDALIEVRHLVPEARTGLLVASRGGRHELERRVRVTGVDFLAMHSGLARRGLIGWAAERGLPAWLWTVNDRRTMRRLADDPRVAAIITDRPERALALAGPSG